MKKFLQYIVFLLPFFGMAQSGMGIYDFSFIPQTNLENPAYDAGNKKHISIPLLGQQNIFVGSSGMSVYDVFADNNVPIETKLQSAVSDMKKSDLMMLQQKMEFFNAGFRKELIYWSFGMYEELNYVSNFPKELSELFYEGTSKIGKKYVADGFKLQSALTTVWHVGLQKEWDRYGTMGVRFKIYNEAFDARAAKVKGTIQFTEGEENLYKINMTGVELLLQTSGIARDNYDDITTGYVLGKTFITGNKGVGIDLGITRDLNDYWYLSTSILDLGFVYHTQHNQNVSSKGDFETEGINLLYDASEPLDYWTNLENSFYDDIHYQENEDKYFTLRPIQWNAMLIHKMGKRRYADCVRKSTFERLRDHHSTYGLFTKVIYNNELILPAVSVFYEKYFSDIVDLRGHYTVNRFSYTNIGFSASAHLWKLNIYTSVNDILGFTNLSKANAASIQFGVNAIW